MLTSAIGFADDVTRLRLQARDASPVPAALFFALWGDFRSDLGTDFSLDLGSHLGTDFSLDLGSHLGTVLGTRAYFGPDLGAYLRPDLGPRNAGGAGPCTRPRSNFGNRPSIVGPDFGRDLDNGLRAWLYARPPFGRPPLHIRPHFGRNLDDDLGPRPTPHIR